MGQAVAHVNTSIGEGVIYIGEAQFLLRPSFRALASIGDPVDIEWTINRVCSAYSALLSGMTPQASAIACCANMISSCSDVPFDLIGEAVEGRTGGIRWKQGRLPWQDVIILAHHCVKWGVQGEPKEKLTKAAKKKMAAQEKQDFDPSEFVAIMVDEFGMSGSDAWNSTMTEFQRLCEHRNRKNWGDRPPPIDDDERDNLISSYQQFLTNKGRVNG